MKAKGAGSYHNNYYGYYNNKPKRVGSNRPGKAKAKGTASSYYSYSYYTYYNKASKRSPKNKKGRSYYYPAYYYSSSYYSYSSYYYYYYHNTQAEMSTAFNSKAMWILVISCLIGVVATGTVFWCRRRRQFSGARYYRKRDAATKSSVYRGVTYHDSTTTDSSYFSTDSSGSDSY